jgi:WD40 repeat protein
MFDDDDDSVDDTAFPCAFIGFASGRVAAVQATLSEDGTCYQFSLSLWHSHGSEVSCLAVVYCMAQDKPILFSACCGGDVYYYPSYTMAVKAFSNDEQCPIFSMTAIEIFDPDRVCYSILSTGDQSGTLSLWYIDVSSDSFYRLEGVKEGQDNHPITVITFIGENLLVAGNNNGDLRFWNIGLSPSINPGILDCRLSLKHDLPGVHTGAVEMCR